ncbi:hypothetical protein D5S17_28915 [Pseudonocardiaceae bacterium YIM PH 21723]|nr:hypothetical protein D5S17_28915 [Pseudonocardiaceae bacterium YIM PH 21723]
MEILDLQREGRIAYLSGGAISGCPYGRTEQPAEVETARKLMWVRGFNAAKHDTQQPAAEAE